MAKVMTVIRQLPNNIPVVARTVKLDEDNGHQLESKQKSAVLEETKRRLCEQFPDFSEAKWYIITTELEDAI